MKRGPDYEEYDALKLEDWDKFTQERKTYFAYMGCYLHMKKLQLMNKLNKPKDRIKWEDVNLENWFTPKHYAEWIIELGNDW
ncbi:MAG: hypothetical protein AABY15_02515, partial [Nanoarchaeota archaeon]